MPITIVPIDLQPQSPFTSIFPIAANSAGFVTGSELQTLPFGQNEQAFLWRNGTYTALGDLPGFAYSDAMAVSNSGEVIGYSYSMGYVGSGGSLLYEVTSEHAFLWQNGQMTDLGGASQSVSVASAINDRGQVVGYEGNQAALWQNGTTTLLGILPSTGGTYAGSEATAINDVGQIVGDSGAGGIHAFLWQNGTMSDLGVLAGTENSDARAINDFGLVVGRSYTDTLSTGNIPVYWLNGAITSLPLLPTTTTSPYPNSGQANAVNDAGQIVGYSGVGAGLSHATLWQDGVVTDLNSLLPANSGWTLSFATSISDNGQIIGTGTYDGASATFEITLAPSGPSIANDTGVQQTLTAPLAYSSIRGSGQDVLDLTGNPVAHTSSSYVLTDNSDGSLTLSTPGSADQVSGVLQIAFSDKTVTIATNNSVDEYIALLYQAALGRTPDAAGLAYWEKIAASLPANALSSGVYGLSDTSANYSGTLSIAAGFTHSAEFTNKYGALTDAQFVTDLYANLLDRSPDSAGYAYWTSALSQGQSRDHVLVGFAASAEAISDATNGYVGQSGTHAAWLFLL